MRALLPSFGGGARGPVRHGQDGALGGWGTEWGPGGLRTWELGGGLKALWPEWRPGYLGA